MIIVEMSGIACSISKTSKILCHQGNQFMGSLTKISQFCQAFWPAIDNLINIYLRENASCNESPCTSRYASAHL